MMCVWLCLACVLRPNNHEPVYGIRHIGERIIRGCASAVLRDCNMIELVHAKLTHTYAATRRPSGMHVGRASVSLSVFSDLFEPPEEGKGIGFPRKHVIPADCTTWDLNKIKKWSILTFFWTWPWLPPPPTCPLGGVLGTACGCDFRGVTFQVDLTSWLDKLSLVKWFEEGPEARLTSQLDKRNLSSWLVKFHLCSKHKKTTLQFQVCPTSNFVGC